MKLLLKIAFYLSLISAADGQPNANWTSRIKSKQRHPILAWLSICDGPYTELRIDGRRFAHVRGLSEFYVRIPGANSIVFVEDYQDTLVKYHIFNMDTDDDTVITARHSSFGYYIGSSDPALNDTVENGTNGIVVLRHFDGKAVSVLPELAELKSTRLLYYLNVPEKSIVAEKIFYYDNSGKVIREIDEIPPF